MGRYVSASTPHGNARAEAGLKLTQALAMAEQRQLDQGQTVEYLINVLASFGHLPREWITGLERECPTCKADAFESCVEPAEDYEREEFGAQFTVCRPHEYRLLPRRTSVQVLRDRVEQQRHGVTTDHDVRRSIGTLADMLLRIIDVGGLPPVDSIARVAMLEPLHTIREAFPQWDDPPILGDDPQGGSDG